MPQYNRNTKCKYTAKIGFAEPHSSVDSVANLRTGGSRFDPRLGQYSFRGLMIVAVTGLIPLSPLSVISTMVMWKSSQWLERIFCGVLVKKPQESMYLCTGRRDITEILLRRVVNHYTIKQSINLIGFTYITDKTYGKE